MEREQVEPRCIASEGYDIPPYANMVDFKVWEQVEPPPGTVLCSRWLGRRPDFG
jgi:hypothetical protein